MSDVTASPKSTTIHMELDPYQFSILMNSVVKAGWPPHGGPEMLQAINQGLVESGLLPQTALQSIQEVSTVRDTLAGKQFIAGGEDVATHSVASHTAAVPPSPTKTQLS